MGLILALESFDTDNADHLDDHTPKTSPQYQDGYDAGYQAGVTAQEAQQNTLSAELVQAVEDMAFGYTEAYSHILQSLLPLFDAITSKILPNIVDASFVTHLTALLNDAAAKDASAPVTFCVHPERLAAIKIALGAEKNTCLSVCADPYLSKNAAWVSAPTNETSLDLDRTLAGICDAFTVLPNSQKGTN